MPEPQSPHTTSPHQTLQPPRTTPTHTMSGAIGKAAAAAGKAASKGAESHVLNKGAKRDPELYVLLGVMAGAFGLAGFYFGRKPTSATSESNVNIAQGSMPWQTESSKGDDAREHFKYQYHPGGDPKNPPKDAPSALHSVIVPNVNLPKELHEKYNKWGKDGY
ncbi:Uncharacterized protein LSUE1_G007802 [Lachnellula suecica]|uniref:Uncharacterized protein n=1 Tax=Lachnellula suecica TaxID=602035 RepID=A0A8T9BXB0_9HELO|nr:Uncharacterized protein LSUE1_G007802 [Lachnellula suecica]